MKTFFADFGDKGLRLPASSMQDAVVAASIISFFLKKDLERLGAKPTRGVTYVEIGNLGELVQ